MGGPDFSFRKRFDGGYTITQRGALGAPLMLDHLLIGLRYLHMLRGQRQLLRISLGSDFMNGGPLVPVTSFDQTRRGSKLRMVSAALRVSGRNSSSNPSGISTQCAPLSKDLPP